VVANPPALGLTKESIAAVPELCFDLESDGEAYLIRSGSRRRSHANLVMAWQISPPPMC
jgi:hypothetical protein